MIQAGDDQRRFVLPRWRTFKATVKSGELSTAAFEATPNSADDESTVLRELARALYFWRETHSPETAEDLIFASLVSDTSNEDIKAAAEFLLGRDSTLLGTQALSKKILGISKPKQQTEQEAHAWLRRKKRQLITNPRDSILCIEIARIHTILGQENSAEKYVYRALKLSPRNRYVARSAIRFYSHWNMNEIAIKYAERELSSTRDPWLLAANIALHSSADKTISNMRSVIRFAENERSFGFDYSELASALGTALLIEGNHKRARKLFKKSLVNPTENAVAQAEWARRQDRAVVVPDAAVRRPDTFEANAWWRYMNADFEGSLESALKWIDSEPFSAGGYIHGSFLLSGVLRRPSEAIKFAEPGLTANPGEPSILNNMAIAYADTGNLDKAADCIERARSASAFPGTGVSLLATEGLIQFRHGNLDAGFELYGEAIDVAAQKGMRVQIVRAKIHLALEVSRFSLTLAAPLMLNARKELEGLKKGKSLVPPDLEVMLSFCESVGVSKG